MKLVSNKKQIYKYFSKEVQTHLEELYEFDNKTDELLLNKIFVFENENKDLKEKNKNIQIDFEVIKKLMNNAQKNLEQLRENYKILQKEEEKLLVKLQSTKKVHNVTNKSPSVNEGLLVVRN